MTMIKVKEMKELLEDEDIKELFRWQRIIHNADSWGDY